MENNNNLSSEQITDGQNDLDILIKKTQKNLEQTENKIKKILDCKINNHSCIIDDLREQEELSKLIVLFHRIERLYAKNRHNYRKLRELDIVFRSLQRAIEFSQILPKDETTRRIRLDIERVIYRQEYSIFGFVSNLFMHVYRSQSVKIKVACGLLASTGFAILALSSSVLIPKSANVISKILFRQEAIAHPRNDRQKIKHPISIEPSLDENFNSYQENKEGQSNTDREPKKLSKNDFRNIIFVLASGTLGGVVSILTRLDKFNAQEFQNSQDIDPAVPFFVGAFKPIIAASFGLLMFALIQSNIVTIDGITRKPDSREKTFFVCAIAFIIGFSERLAQDVIKKTEDTVVGTKHNMTKEIELLKNSINSLDKKIQNLHESSSQLSNDRQPK